MEGIRIIKINEKEIVKEDLKEVRIGLNKVSSHYFSNVVDSMRESVMLVLIGMFGRLRWEDIEEVYDDGCMVLWNKMNERDFELRENSIRSYMIMICRYIGMHYLRGVRDDVMSLDEMLEFKGKELEDDAGCEMNDVFDVMDEGKDYDEDERYRKLDEVWERLSDVDKMILECYYWDGYKMKEIAQRIGYKNADSVKSKKSKVLRKIMEMMSHETKKAADSLPSPVIICTLYPCRSLQYIPS